MASLLVAKTAISRSRTVAFRPGLFLTAKKTRTKSTVADMNELRRQLDTTKSESTVRFDQLMKAMMDQNANISNQTSSQILKMSTETSNRMDKMLALVLGFIVAGVGYLSHEMDNKIKTGNTLLKKEMETGNAQLKEDLMKALKPRSFMGKLIY